MLLLLTFLLTAPLPAASADSLKVPFGAGETMSYTLTSARFGRIGAASMRVEEAEPVRGKTLLRLCFELEGRVLLLPVRDVTTSLLDITDMSSHRYEKAESSPLGTYREQVEIFPTEGRWASPSGAGGPLHTPAPLDELSYLYFVRTLPLRDGDSYVSRRHFDVARSPVLIRVLERKRIKTRAGEFAVIVVEMRVPKVGRIGGDGRLLLHLSDDERRLIVRMESTMPVAGRITLDLDRAEAGGKPDAAAPNAAQEIL